MRRVYFAILSLTATSHICAPAYGIEQGTEKYFDALKLHHTATCLVEYGKFEMRYVGSFLKKSREMMGITMAEYKQVIQQPSWKEDVAWLWKRKGEASGCDSINLFFSRMIRSQQERDVNE